MFWKIVSIAAAVFVIAVAVSWFTVRPWAMRWGATDEEVAMTLPGDELAPNSRISYTRAITINAPADQVYPWIKQLGQERGGLYSYDWLENLAGCNIHSADRIHPEWQTLAVGDNVRLGPKGYPLYKVQAIEENQYVLMLGADPVTEQAPDVHNLGETYMVGTWLFYLMPVDDSTTRLILRSHLDFEPDSFGNQAMWQITSLADFIMGQKMLRGIRDRAEGAAELVLAAP